jgi:hypothetical protein
MSKTVYIPVAVTVHDDGEAVAAFIDYEGAPWMYVGREDVFNEDTGEWESSLVEDGNAEVVNAAESFIHDRIKEVLNG